MEALEFENALDALCGGILDSVRHASIKMALRGAEEGFCLAQGKFLERTFYSFCREKRLQNETAIKRYARKKEDLASRARTVPNPRCLFCRFGKALDKQGKLEEFPKNIEIIRLEKEDLKFIHYRGEEYLRTKDNPERRRLARRIEDISGKPAYKVGRSIFLDAGNMFLHFTKGFLPKKIQIRGTLFERRETSLEELSKIAKSSRHVPPSDRPKVFRAFDQEITKFFVKPLERYAGILESGEAFLYEKVMLPENVLDEFPEAVEIRGKTYRKVTDAETIQKIKKSHKFFSVGIARLLKPFRHLSDYLRAWYTTHSGKKAYLFVLKDGKMVLYL